MFNSVRFNPLHNGSYLIITILNDFSDKVNIQQLEQTGQNGELQLIETQINTSQISMTTHSPVTPSNSSLMSPQQQQTIIPTRFIDRRVSTGVASSDPYKFNVNYSEAGQRLAKKAHQQIKTLEKSKEVEVVIDNDGHSVSSSSSRRLSNTSTEAINNFDSSSNLLGDDWQNVIVFLISIFLSRIYSHISRQAIFIHVYINIFTFVYKFQ
jgi:hypothetical protein